MLPILVIYALKMELTLNTVYSNLMTHTIVWKFHINVTKSTVNLFIVLPFHLPPILPSPSTLSLLSLLQFRPLFPPPLPAMSLWNNFHCTHKLLISRHLHLHRTADWFRGLRRAALRCYPISLCKFAGIGQLQFFETLMDRELAHTDTARTNEAMSGDTPQPDKGTYKKQPWALFHHTATALVPNPDCVTVVRVDCGR